MEKPPDSFPSSWLPAFFPAARSSPEEAVCSLTSLSLVVSIAGACKGEGGGKKKKKKKSFSTTRNPCSTAFGVSCLFPTLEKEIVIKGKKKQWAKREKKGKKKNWGWGEEKKKKKKNKEKKKKPVQA